VEYDGIQHTKFVPYFHKTIEQYNEACYRDELKNDWANDNAYLLCRIPWDADVHATLDEFVKEYS
jgi:hypothetical protein